MSRLSEKLSQTQERFFDFLGVRLQSYRDTLLLVVDGTGLLCGWAYAVLVAHPGTSISVWLLPLLVGVFVAAGFLLGTYRNRWSVASFAEAVHLAGALGASLLAATIAIRFFDRDRGSTNLAVAEATLLVAVLVSGLTRMVWRLGWERHLAPDATAKPVIIVNSGRTGEQAARAMMLEHDSSYRPVGFVDNDRLRANRQVMGIPVLGTFEELIELASEVGAGHILVAEAGTWSPEVNDLVNTAKAAQIEVLTLPPVRELYGDDVRASDIRPLREVDFLNRREVTADTTAIGDYLSGKRILVTGAGGSIGSELCRQISAYAPGELIMVDRDESGLHSTQLSIEGHALLNNPNLVVADIRDVQRLGEIFQFHKPEIVFHAAALKHLPLLEMHPSEAWKSNVLGTLNVLEAAKESGVETFVNISTDKAANPCSVLGYSKRVAERLTAAFAETSSGRYLSVRFGNVLGSRGSMLETFRGQMRKGEPLTVTHPDITRYFMTVEEAVLLLIQAGAIGRTGEVLILDMGEPVKIVDVAQRMASLVNPPAEIRFVGLRPNEKMHEELFGPGEIDARPIHPLVSHVRVEPLSLKSFQQILHGANDLNHHQLLVDLISTEIDFVPHADAR